MRIITIVFIISVGLSGCVSNSIEPPNFEPQKPTIKAHRFHGFGTPDRISPLNKLGDLLERERRCSRKQMREIMRNIQLRIDVGLEQSATAKTSKLQSLEGKEVWLYAWNHPEEIAISGIVPHVVSKKSTYIVIDGENVLAGGDFWTPP